ncbi:MAG: ABC transporter permease, partial [Patescibacteria group bacterium]|nr:ABC transporter permease [Patescibacteria group bacterium]
VLVLSAGEGFRSLVDAQVAAYGTNTLFIETRVPPTTKNRGASNALSADTSRASTGVAITSFKGSDLENVKKLPNVVNAYGMVVGQKVASYKDNVKNVMIYGAGAARFDIDQGKLSEGRFYTQGEDTGGDQVAILGATVATDIFGQDDPVGKLLRVGNLNFAVIGVYESRGALGADEDSAIYVPLGTAQKKILGIDYLLVGIVELKDVNMAQATAEDIRTVMREDHRIIDPEKDDFMVMTQADAMTTFNTIFNGITFLLVAIAAISLVVGGVGIMNIMYVVVTERTAEIGLKKALGATQADIQNEFLIEAVLVTIIGGFFGILGGTLMSYLMALIAHAAKLEWVFVVPPYAIGVGFGVSAAIGIFFGVFPARAAAKLDPVEAMRYE